MMRNTIWYSSVSLIIILVFTFTSFNSCKKEESTPAVEYGAVTDIDGNIYDAVTIGTQTWLTENLKTTKYRNGDQIPTGLADNDWSGTAEGAYAIYDDNTLNSNTYGLLYNWFAVVDDRYLCPSGWHVPSDDEWDELISFLGGKNVAGGKLKEAGTTHWNSPNIGTNTSLFTALPGGQRKFYGPYAALGDYGYWWSTTEGFASGSWGWSMVNSENIVNRINYTRSVGFSVRCLRD